MVTRKTRNRFGFCKWFQSLESILLYTLKRCCRSWLTLCVWMTISSSLNGLKPSVTRVSNGLLVKNVSECPLSLTVHYLWVFTTFEWNSFNGSRCRPTLEPTSFSDQQSRYLNHWAWLQLRSSFLSNCKMDGEFTFLFIETVQWSCTGPTEDRRNLMQFIFRNKTPWANRGAVWEGD